MDGVLEVQLYVKKVRPESFRLYTLVADNGFTSATASVAMTSSRLRLVRLFASVKTQQRVAYSNSATYVAIALRQSLVTS